MIGKDIQRLQDLIDSLQKLVEEQEKEQEKDNKNNTIANEVTVNEIAE